MSAMTHHLVPRHALGLYGRRGLVLLLIGLAWIVRGIFTIIDREGHAFQPGAAVPHEATPWPFLGTAWVISGLVGAVVGLWHRTEDHLGWLAVSAMPLIHTGSYLVSFVTWAFTDGLYGWRFALFPALIWALVCLLIAVFSSWPEPPKVVVKDGSG